MAAPEYHSPHKFERGFLIKLESHSYAGGRVGHFMRILGARWHTSLAAWQTPLICNSHAWRFWLPQLNSRWSRFECSFVPLLHPVRFIADKLIRKPVPAPANAVVEQRSGHELNLKFDTNHRQQ